MELGNIISHPGSDSWMGMTATLKVKTSESITVLKQDIKRKLPRNFGVFSVSVLCWWLCMRLIPSHTREQTYMHTYTHIYAKKHTKPYRHTQNMYKINTGPELEFLIWWCEIVFPTNLGGVGSFEWNLTFKIKKTLLQKGEWAYTGHTTSVCMCVYLYAYTWNYLGDSYILIMYMDTRC